MLTDDQKDFYAEQGYVLIKGLLSPEEAATYRQEAHALMEQLASLCDLDATWGSAPKRAGQATRVLGVHAVPFQSAAFARLMMNERLTGAAAAIIGPNVPLHHVKMFIKPPENGSPFPRHQDAPFFPTKSIP